MKITVNINNVPTEITLTDEQIALIHKPKKFKFDYDNNSYVVTSINITKINESLDHKNNVEHGRYRLTEDSAKNSLARNRRANRLEALAEHLGGLREFVCDEPNYCIFCLYTNKEFRVNSMCFTFEPEKVYMTQECAIEICRMLNNNEFSLQFSTIHHKGN